MQGGFALLASLLSFSGPFFLNKIIKFIENPQSLPSDHYALLLVLGLFACAMTRACADGQAYFLGRRIGTRVRASLISELYSKSLRRIQHASRHHHPTESLKLPHSEESPATETTPFNTSSKPCPPQDASPSLIDNKNAEASNGTHSGEIINLMSVDTNKILEVSCYLIYIWTTPLQICICIGFLLSVLGWPALAGVALMVLMIPVGGTMAKIIAKKQKQLMKSTDQRIHSMNELLNGIRLVKFYAWETNFLSKIDANREKELSNLWSYILTIASNKILWYSTPIIVSFLTFLALTWIAKEELTPSKAFTGLALFNTLRHPLQVFPDIIVRIEEALVSIKRISKFLDEPDLNDYPTLGFSEKESRVIGFPRPSTFSYPSYQESSLSSPESAFTLQNIQIEFPEKGLTVISGPTGSGKSSLILALLSEMKCLSGGSTLKTHFKEIAFVPQQVWLMNATIRENILFGQDLHENKYKKVLHCCSLVQDLDTLPAKDLTEVGEGGINLSGGQKARIALARAAYSNAPCVLLDDPLSAVDAPTAKHLFENCICGPFMSSKTRVLVTHAVALCSPKADHLVVLKKGRVEKQGSPLDLTLTDSSLGASSSSSGNTENTLLPSSHISITDETAKKRPTSGKDKDRTRAASSTPKTEIATEDKAKQGVLIEDEAKSVGSVSGDVYWFYLQSAGGPFFVAVLLCAFAASQSLVVANDWWLKTWANSHLREEENKGGWTVEDYLLVYGAIGVMTILVLLTRIMLVAKGSIHASRHLHHILLRRIMSATIRFFETTPTGRILNRFSKDMKDIDQEVAIFSAEFLANCVSAFATMSIIVFVTPVTLLGVLPVGKFFLKYLRFFV